MLIWFNKSAIVQAETRLKAEERIALINEIIDTLLAAQIEFAADPNKQEYGLDDGQTKIKVIYRNLDAVAASIVQWDKVLQMYLNRVNGRMVRLVDSKNFPKYNFGI
jgi:hypothetical protein